MLCDHANEVPAQCSCFLDCYCYVEGSCRVRDTGRVSSTESALDMLMKTASCAVETCISMITELDRYKTDYNFLIPGSVYRMLRDQADELQSALSEAHHATTTEQPTSGETKSSSTLSAILEAIEESVHQIAQNTQILVSKQPRTPKVSKTCKICKPGEVCVNNEILCKFNQHLESGA